MGSFSVGLAVGLCHNFIIPIFSLRRGLFTQKVPCTMLTIDFILMGKRELVALLDLSSWCLVMFEWLFLAVPRGCLRFVIVVFPDHTHLLFFRYICYIIILLQAEHS